MAAVYTAVMRLLPDGSRKFRDEYVRIHDMIQFLEKEYHICYAENSRETIRKKAVRPLVEAGVIEDNGLAKTSPRFGYHAVYEWKE